MLYEVITEMVMMRFVLLLAIAVMAAGPAAAKDTVPSYNFV